MWQVLCGDGEVSYSVELTGQISASLGGGGEGGGRGEEIPICYILLNYGYMYVH